MLRHSIFCHHRLCHTSSLFDILGGASGNVIKNQFLCHSAAQIYYNFLKHPALGVKHLFTLRKRHGIACSTHACRNDRHRIYGSYIRQHMKQNRMACFMVCRNPFLFICNNTAPFFRTNPNLDK